MVAAFISIVIIAIVIAIVIVAVLAARKSREAVGVGATEGAAGPSASSYFDPDSSSTGAVEVLEPSLTELFDLALDATPEVPAPAPEIRWSKQFDPRSGVLDDTARLRLIGDLGVVAKEWCVPLLCQAYTEEQRPAYRQAALIALATCRSRAAIPTYRLALAAADAQERAIAADALADLEPPLVTKQQTVVERR